MGTTKLKNGNGFFSSTTNRPLWRLERMRKIIIRVCVNFRKLGQYSKPEHIADGEQKKKK